MPPRPISLTMRRDSNPVARPILFLFVHVRCLFSRCNLARPGAYSAAGASRKPVAARVGGDERLDLDAKPRVAGAGTSSAAPAPPVQFQHVIENRLDARPFLGVNEVGIRFPVRPDPA